MLVIFKMMLQLACSKSKSEHGKLQGQVGFGRNRYLGCMLASCFKPTTYTLGLYYFCGNISVPLQTARHLMEIKILFLSLFSINHRMMSI